MSVIDTNITNPTISDHSAITFTLQSKEYAKRGPGFWKINNVSLYAIIIFIYIATTLPPQQTYRTHSPSPITPSFKIGNSRRNIKLLVTGYVINYLTADCHMPNRKEGKWPRDFNALGKCLL